MILQTSNLNKIYICYDYYEGRLSSARLMQTLNTEKISGRFPAKRTVLHKIKLL